MSDTVRDWDMNATLTMAILREHLGDKNDVCSQKRRIRTSSL